MFHRIYTLICKELNLLFRDRLTRVILFLPVIMQVCVFPFAATLDVTNATIAVYNQDNGRSSTEVINRLTHSTIFSKIIMLKNPERIETILDDQVVSLILRFPTNFSKQLENREATQVQIILDGRNSNSAQITANYVQQIIYEYQQEFFNYKSNGLVVRHWYNPNLNYKWFVLPSLIALMITIGVLIVTSLSIAREREQGTFDQLLVSPLKTWQIFVGKAVPAILVAIAQGSIVLFSGIFIYGIDFHGSMTLYYLCMTLYGLSLVGFGMLISSLCATQQQAFIGIIFFMVPAILLSGYVSPVENMPEWLQTATWINPVRHFTHISKQIYLKGADFHIIEPNFIALVFIIITTGSIAYLLFKRNIG